MNKRFIKTPLKGVVVQDTKNVGTRTVNLLMGEHAGEYVRGDIMDANAVIQAFDELKDGVDEGHDTLKELNEEIKANAEVIQGAIVAMDKAQKEAKQLIEAEAAARQAADTELEDKIGDINTILDKINGEVA